MSFVADAGTFGAAAQGPSKATSAALENILVDVLSSGPCETAGVVATEDMEWRIIGTAAALTQREDEALHNFFLSG